LADAENLRERTRKEKEVAQQLAIKSFAKDLLNISDILDLALEAVPQNELEQNASLKNLFTGLSMTRTELLSVFKKHGLSEIEALEQQFDPNKHEALFQVPMEGKKPGTVFNVAKKGYALHGIVIRASQVGVAQ
jgi:molecular chaperone GrpE